MTLAAAIWSVPQAMALAYVPHVVRGIVISRYGGKIDNTKPRAAEDQTSNLPKNIQDLTTRLKNSHVNQLETLGVFAGGVAVCLAVQMPAETLVKLTSNYLKSRLAYTLAYAAPQVAKGGLRSLSFFACIGSLIMLYSAAAKTVAVGSE